MFFITALVSKIVKELITLSILKFLRIESLNLYKSCLLRIPCKESFNVVNLDPFTS